MARKATATAEVISLGGDNTPSNGGKDIIEYSEPYTVEVTIEGVADLLMHAWNPDAVDAKASAAKGSKAKKSDDIESYVYRDDNGFISIPGDNLRGAIIAAAKYRQDPRSPRKSAMDLFKAGVASLTKYASLGVREWDYEDRRRVVVQRSGINRTRPAMRVGWRATFKLLITLPEYIAPSTLNEVISAAGRLCGIGDFRPSYGRFVIVKYTVL